VASLAKRLMMPGRLRTSLLANLSATERPAFAPPTSVARKTAPMPPSPSICSSRYFPPTADPIAGERLLGVGGVVEGTASPSLDGAVRSLTELRTVGRLRRRIGPSAERGRAGVARPLRVPETPPEEVRRESVRARARFLGISAAKRRALPWRKLD